MNGKLKCKQNHLSHQSNATSWSYQMRKVQGWIKYQKKITFKSNAEIWKIRNIWNPENQKIRTLENQESLKSEFQKIRNLKNQNSRKSELQKSWKLEIRQIKGSKINNNIFFSYFDQKIDIFVVSSNEWCLSFPPKAKNEDILAQLWCVKAKNANDFDPSGEIRRFITEQQTWIE